MLGFLNYYRDFIKNFSEKTMFITEKLSKGNNWQWMEDDKTKLSEIMSEIKRADNLSFPDPNKPFQLYTDAADKAIGAILKQGKFTIGNYSHKLSKSEINYSVMEKEALAIIKAVQYFRSIILTSRVEIFTDNANLLHNKDLTTRVQRWKILLEELNFELKGIEGAKNVIADHLSRSFLMETNNLGKDENKFHSILRNILGRMKHREMMNEKEQTPNMPKHGVSNEIIGEYLEVMHVLLGHPGFNKLYYTIKPYITSPNLKKSIKETCSKCLSCQTSKRRYNKYGVYGNPIISYKVFDYISSDILGPIKTKHFKNTHNGDYFYLLTITDICSRFTRVYYLKDITSESVMRGFNSWYNLYPLPTKLLTDNGRQYISTKFKNQLEKFKIKHIQTSAYNPCSNGISERINLTIKQILRINKNMPIKKAIQMAEVNLNFTYNRHLKSSPYEMIEKLQAVKSESERETIIKTIKDIELRNKISEINIKNQGRKKFTFRPGDKVLIRNNSQDKIDDLYIGPYVITEIDQDNGFIFIQKGSYLSRQNIKNVISFYEGGGCRGHTTMISRNFQDQLWKFLENQKYKNNFKSNPYDVSANTSKPKTQVQ
ncbi:Transposon Tf2-11 polyprotein [Dictyocoela roeselum]|nr:Transposon Tf2-11 polyprotein [Dictyocoela roeselum]